MRKKIVILLGAGFPTIWRADVTWELTKNARRNFSFNAGSFSEKFPASIRYQQLATLLWNQDDSPFKDHTFEDDISFFDGSNKSKEHNDCFNSAIRELEFVVTSDDGLTEHFWDYQGLNLTLCSNEIDPRGYLKQHILRHYLRCIYHELPYINQLPSGERAQRIQTCIKFWLKSLQDQDCILRFYSLNYDQHIVNMFPKYDFFNGFEGGKPAVLKIPKYDGNVYFNLHGSFNFRLDLTELSPFLSFVNIPESPLEPGDHNVIAGSSGKDKKILELKPLNSFIQQFSTDLQSASNIIILGYSASDDHINDILKKSRVNPIVVDPNNDLVKKFKDRTDLNIQLKPITTEDFLWEVYNHRNAQWKSSF